MGRSELRAHVHVSERGFFVCGVTVGDLAKAMHALDLLMPLGAGLPIAMADAVAQQLRGLGYAVEMKGPASWRQAS